MYSEWKVAVLVVQPNVRDSPPSRAASRSSTGVGDDVERGLRLAAIRDRESLVAAGASGTWMLRHDADRPVDIVLSCIRVVPGVVECLELRLDSGVVPARPAERRVEVQGSWVIERVANTTASSAGRLPVAARPGQVRHRIHSG